ncbi:MAG: efflux transporter outer membrane subunit, partial [Bdellovibrionota bacterium]
AGTANYLQLLVANGQFHQAQIGHTQATAQRIQDSVALFVALGGGWWSSPKPLVETLAGAAQSKAQ